jgi:ABC-type Zn uptake system ZnuABC Zn-binding protein ZnuA
MKASAFMTESPMPMISTSVRYMGDLIKLMVGNKKRTVFSETTVMQEVMKELKEGSKDY